MENRQREKHSARISRRYIIQETENAVSVDLIPPRRSVLS
jgi:hypothetical protein